ncbi:MAG: murein biosynthesis integral membrane protein MurJ [Polyangiales bacterium]
MPDTPPPSTRGERANARMALLAVGTLASRVLGMLRETLIAATFTVAETDAFFLAWRIPNALRSLLAEGALSTAFVPVFSSTLERGTAAPGEPSPDGPAGEHHDALREAVARVRGASLAVLVPLSVLGVLFARPLTRLLAGDFRGDAAQFELASTMLSWLFPYIFFMGSAAVGIGVLQSYGRVAALAFAPALLNVAFLLAPFAFVPVAVKLGLPAVTGLAWGALLGGALQLLALVPSLRRLGMLPRPVLDLGHPAVRRIAVLMGPGLLGVAIYQVDVVLSNRLLASLPHGAVSFFNYAQRVADIPQGILILSIANGFLPDLCRAVSAGDRGDASRLLGRMLRLAAFASIPVAVLLATFGEALVPVIYGYGRFRELGPQGVAEVVSSLRWQSANVALLAFVRQLTATYSAAQDTRTPVLVSAIDLGAFIALALALRGPMGHAGVAAAITGSTLVQLVFLALWISRRVPLPWREVTPTVLKVLVASAPVAALSRVAVASLPLHGDGFRPKLLAVACAVGLGTVYLLAAWLLQIEEVAAVLARFTRRLRRRRGTA